MIRSYFLRGQIPVDSDSDSDSDEDNDEFDDDDNNDNQFDDENDAIIYDFRRIIKFATRLQLELATNPKSSFIIAGSKAFLTGTVVQNTTSICSVYE